MRLRRLICGAVSLLVGAGAGPTARAEDQPVADAREVAGLFVKGCVPYAGDPQGLRRWANSAKLRPLPAKDQDTYLNGMAGIAYDARDVAPDAANRGNQFVVISEDNGACSAVAERADGKAVIAALEEIMRQQGFAVEFISEKQDSLEKGLRHRTYDASKGQRTVSLVVSTSSNAPASEAMLTAIP